MIYNYIIPTYYQASYYFLLPLVTINFKKITPINSYCSSTIFDKTIDDGCVIGEYTMNNDITEDELIRLSTEKNVLDLKVTNNKLYILYDIIDSYPDEYLLFIDAKYSEYSDYAKNEILIFFNVDFEFPITPETQPIIGDKRIVSLLAPKLFEKDILYEIEHYTGEKLSEISEIGRLYDKEKEHLIL